jgi:hypothetical protein
MSSPYNEDGEPIMSHSQWMQECWIDEQDRYYDREDCDD